MKYLFDLLNRFANRYIKSNADIVSKRALYRKRELIGAQGVLIIAFLYQPFVLLFTKHTAISRFADQWGEVAYWYASSVLVVDLLLYLDFHLCVSDIWRGTSYTSTTLGAWMDKHRAWGLYYCGAWSCMLMTTANIESGFTAWLSYALLFFGFGFAATFVALRDGCIDNNIYKEGGDSCTNGSKTQ